MNMKYSSVFGKTVRKVSDQIKNASYMFLVKGGYIRESSAGRFYLLPLGMRVMNKITKIIREEMDKIGAQEMVTPILHPIALWEKTSRTEAVGFELTTLKDRRGSEFVLGGTAEEMFVELVKNFNLSYRDLPFNLYQFSMKFRDELRVRGGLLRLREFMMKDAYSFDIDEVEFKKTYGLMAETYHNIFKRLGLCAMVVESDNGYIGGEYCHEFVVESEQGESVFLMTEDGSYAAHEDVAKFQRDSKNINEELEDYEEVKVERGKTMEEGVKWHKKPLWQQLKNVMYMTEKNEYVLAVIRGDYEVNEAKLAHVIKAYNLRLATNEEIVKIGSAVGFISPVDLKGKVKIIGDLSLRTIRNAYGGANENNKDAVNINIDRDYQCDLEADIALAKEGYESLENKGKLILKRGIEVGNIFQLGYHYSKLMGAKFTDEKGEEKFYYMGCYGIGLARTLATIIEKYHDEKGIIWPEEVSPYKVHLISLGDKKEIREKAEKLYKSLERKKIEVLWDDRENMSAGEKFFDADLIGCLYRIILSEKTMSEEKYEFKKREEKQPRFLEEDEILSVLG